jgi:hypothetical protein
MLDIQILRRVTDVKLRSKDYEEMTCRTIQSSYTRRLVSFDQADLEIRIIVYYCLITVVFVTDP